MIKIPAKRKTLEECIEHTLFKMSILKTIYFQKELKDKMNVWVNVTQSIVNVNTLLNSIRKSPLGDKYLTKIEALEIIESQLGKIQGWCKNDN